MEVIIKLKKSYWFQKRRNISSSSANPEHILSESFKVTNSSGFFRRAKIESAANRAKVSRPTEYKCIKKALAEGIEMALKDYYHYLKKPRISEEAKAWIIHLACAKPKDLGFAAEMWTQRELAKYAQKNGPLEGHDCLIKANITTVHRILKSHSLQPHKTRYYLMMEEKQLL